MRLCIVLHCAIMRHVRIIIDPCSNLIRIPSPQNPLATSPLSQKLILATTVSESLVYNFGVDIMISLGGGGTCDSPLIIIRIQQEMKILSINP